ncbi:methyltransferase family protein [Jannaschia seohaensis]|uniref:Protein-S-isoprenylcysteine O-methyltransferase Ste14 n=1 Tax=Jannaschia seohaensis TaxID=475081 RepID=A0A2Y9AWS9_9RHOB|nr:isoprenylcysteine carboxylmethyltransferase family protein [Jannaschia seohaensis]PWJ18017.1 protein-S-isoprenylcysteine O-methyltransferase Ste14 [Jannaschia seohaensis]SSA46539.1 Protein-S-isoprenylcysteine O-methyltransferase Ste14 [Jannaschia seohaensis]
MNLARHLKGFPDLPPIWLLGALFCVWSLGRGPGPSAAGAIGQWLGGALIVAALALIGWAALWFLRKRTPIEPHHRPEALIVEGPYRISRNPIYLALVTIALGAALRQDSLLALLPVPGLWWVLDRRFAAPEEAGLRSAFGSAAEPYLKATRRWI